jgi:hypothetical protein
MLRIVLPRDPIEASILAGPLLWVSRILVCSFKILIVFF